MASTPFKRLPVPVMDDAAMLAVVQGMTEAEFGEYVGHLARVWSWGRMRRSA